MSAPQQTPGASSCGSTAISSGILPTPEGVVKQENLLQHVVKSVRTLHLSLPDTPVARLLICRSTPGKFVSSHGSDGATDPRTVLTDPPQIQETVRVLFSTSSVGASSGSDVGTQLGAPSSAAERPVPTQPCSITASGTGPSLSRVGSISGSIWGASDPSEPEVDFNDGCTTGVLPTPANQNLMSRMDPSKSRKSWSEGCKPGDVFGVVIKDGRELSIACPTDANPGDILEIDVPPLTPGQRADHSPSRATQSV